jgi:sugar lactone lactonase YvrE
MRIAPLVLVIGLQGLAAGLAVAGPSAAPDSSAKPARSSGVSAPAPSAAYDTLRTPVAPPTDSTAAPALPFVLRVEAAIAHPDEGPGQMVRPAGVALDAFGRVYVTDRALHRLQRFAPDGKWIGENGALGSEDGALRRPGDVVTAGALAMAVLDEENLRILSYDLFGLQQRTLVELGPQGLGSSAGRIDPVALASDRGGALYVADADRDRILILDAGGRLSGTITSTGADGGAFRGLAGLAVSRRGQIVVAERTSARIQRLDAGGRMLARFAIDVRPGRGRVPVAIDDSLRIAVADEATGRLWVFDADGTLLARREKLSRPWALVFGAAGELWVTESGSGRVTRLRLARPTPGRAPAKP